MSSQTYRGQCNLHLFLARQYLNQLTEGNREEWGGHFHRACLESSLWQLRLAYESHLADLLFQQPRFQQAIPIGRYSARVLSSGEHPPEIAELADRESHDARLKWVLEYAFINAPSAVQASSGALIASSRGEDDSLQRSWEALEFLSDTVNRHRATLQEY